jgi:electron transfer flavoprotein alpha subunit
MTPNSVVVCTWGEDKSGLAPGAEEVLSLGHKLSKQLGCELAWLTLGAAPAGNAEVAGRYGVASLQQVEDAKLEGISADVVVEALAQYCGQASPSVLLFNQGADVRVIAPRLAGRLGSAVVMNGVEMVSEDGKFQVTAAAANVAAV